MRDSFSFSILVALCGIALTVSLVHSHRVAAPQQWFDVTGSASHSELVPPSATAPSYLQNHGVAFVTNGTSDYWRLVHQGVEQAERELGIQVDFRMVSTRSADEQTQVLDDVINKGALGVTFVPAAPASEMDVINRTSANVAVFTAGEDIPQTNRACFVGSNSATASSQIALTLKEVLPQGGTVAVLAGLTDLQNGLDQVIGLKAELAESGVHIAGVYANQRFERRRDILSVLSKHPHLDALVALGGYNGAAILNALRDEHRKNQVKVICTDVDQATLDGIKKGAITATIAPSPIELGYLSATNMVKYLGGDQSVVMPSHQVSVPTQIIDKNNIDTLSENKDEF